MKHPPEQVPDYRAANLMEQFIKAKQFQFVQEDEHNLYLKIVGKPFNTKHIEQHVNKLTGMAMKFHIEFVEEIPRTASGKLRWGMSKVPLEF